MTNSSKLVYEPLSLATSVLGGVLAGQAFQRVWKRLSRSDTTPNPQDLRHPIGQVLLAAALQGALFGLAKSAVDRATAHGYAAITKENPT
jgi:hypothetical protein